MSGLTITGKLHLGGLIDAASNEVLAEAALRGAKHVAEVSLQQVPRLTGELADSQKVEADPGDGSASIRYTKFTARWQHERLDYHHPQGGNAKYLEIPLMTEADEALDLAADEIGRHL